MSTAQIVISAIAICTAIAIAWVELERRPSHVEDEGCARLGEPPPERCQVDVAGREFQGFVDSTRPVDPSELAEGDEDQ